MASQDLLNAIAAHAQEGADQEEIKDLLVSEGWQAEAIDAAFEELAKNTPSIWQQLPTYPYFQALDAKTANLPPKVVWGISGLLVVLVILTAVIIYFSMNPFMLGGSDRDKVRVAVSSQLNTAINNYHAAYLKFPESLAALVPNYIKFVPLDPKTNNPYDYIVSEDKSSYSLCILYETKSVSEGCLNTEVINAERFGIPVPTSAPGE